MKGLLLLVAVVASVSGVPRFLMHRKRYPDGRIVGGEPLDITQVPYQVSLEWNNRHICGGSIASPTHIITAAHCSEDSEPEEFKVRAGTSIRQTGGVLVDVVAIYEHPDYDWWLIDYDISILELKEPLEFGPNLAAVGLPELRAEYSPGTSTLVTGWGTLESGASTLPEQLQGVEVHIVSQGECIDAYGSWDVTDRMICAAHPEGGKDSCQGDSGGPLTVDGVLVGIVSWGYGCAVDGYPGVYSNVPSLREHITKVVGV